MAVLTGTSTFRTMCHKPSLFHIVTAVIIGILGLYIIDHCTLIAMRYGFDATWEGIVVIEYNCKFFGAALLGLMVSLILPLSSIKIFEGFWAFLIGLLALLFPLWELSQLLLRYAYQEFLTDPSELFRIHHFTQVNILFFAVGFSGLKRAGATDHRYLIGGLLSLLSWFIYAVFGLYRDALSSLFHNSYYFIGLFVFLIVICLESIVSILVFDVLQNHNKTRAKS